jgi:hypothetical protein
LSTSISAAAFALLSSSAAWAVSPRVCTPMVTVIVSGVPRTVPVPRAVMAGGAADPAAVAVVAPSGSVAHPASAMVATTRTGRRWSARFMAQGRSGARIGWTPDPVGG